LQENPRNEGKACRFCLFQKSVGKGGLTRRWLTADYLAEGLQQFNLKKAKQLVTHKKLDVRLICKEEKGKGRQTEGKYMKE
jgi:hypothetical protein